MRFHQLLVLSVACSVGLMAQSTSPNPATADPHESPSSPVNKPVKAKASKVSSNSSSTLIGGASLSAQDKTFIREATKAGRAEVAQAQVMVDHSGDAGVKDFAQKLVTDHTKANADLASVAQGKGVTLAPETAGSTKAKQMKDKAYVAAEILNHRKAIQLFETEASLGLDPDMRSFASNALPTLQGHLKMAKSLQAGEVHGGQ